MQNIKPKFLITVLLLLCLGLSAQFDKFPRTDYDKDWKYVYKDSLGNVLFGRSFDQGGPFMKGVAVVQNKVGEETHSALIDKKGKIIIPFANHFIQNQLNGFIEIGTAEGTKVVTTTGKLITQCENCQIVYYNKQQRFSLQPAGYNYGQEFKNPLTSVKMFDFKGKQLFDMKGEKISCLTDQIQNYPEYKFDTVPCYVIQVNRDQYGGAYDIVTENGKVILDSVTGNYHPLLFIKGLMSVWRKDQWAVYDRNFTEVISFREGYDYMYEMHEHPNAPIYSVCKNGKCGAVDVKNKVVMPLKYKYPLSYDKEFKCYQMISPGQDSSWAFSSAGDTINAPGYKRIGDKLVLPYTSIYTDRNTGKFGYINNRTRDFVIPPVYDYLSEAVNDSVLFFRGDTAGFMNPLGKKIFTFPVPCYAASRFSNNRAFCLLGLPEGKAGIPKKPNEDRDSYRAKYVWINKKGTIINGAVFDWFAKYENGKAMVSNDGEFYFVDSTYKRVKFKGKYDYYSYFRQGFAVIGEGASKFGLIDEKGNIVIPVIYDAIDTKPEQDQASIYRGIPDGIPLIDQTGRETSSNGLTYVPDIIEGTINVSKNEVAERITLPGFKTPTNIPEPTMSDTLEVWYQTNHDLFVDRIEREHIPLDGKEVSMIPFRQDSLFGFVSKRSGEWIIKPQFEEVYAVYREGAIVRINGSYGVVDTLGKLLFSGFSQIFKERNLFHGMNFYYPLDTNSRVPEHYRTYIYNAYYTTKGKLIFEEKAHDLSSFNEFDSLAYFRFGKTYKIVGESGAVYVRARMTSVSKVALICNNLLIYRSVINSKTHFSAFDARNKLKFRVPLNFDHILGPYQINNNLYGFVGRGGIYFADAKGDIKPYGLEERSIEDPDKYFVAKQFVVQNFNKKRYGVINRKGEVIIPFQFKYLGNFVNGYALYTDSLDQYGFVTLTGKKIPGQMNRETLEMAFMLGKAPSFYDSLTFVKQYCPYKQDQQEINAYSEREEQEETQPVCLLYYDTKGNVAFRLTQYSMAGYFCDGLAPVLDLKGNFGFINKRGEEVIPPEYEATMAGSYPMPYVVVPEFKNGYAYIKSFKGYIDKTGKKYFSGIQLKDHFDFSH